MPGLNKTLPTADAGPVERGVRPGAEARPLVERLRQQWPDTPHHRDMLHREAADEIERLRAAAQATLDYLTGPATRNNATDKSAADALRAGMAAGA